MKGLFRFIVLSTLLAVLFSLNVYAETISEPINNVYAPTNTSVKVVFNEEVNKDAAENISNYSIVRQTGSVPLNIYSAVLNEIKKRSYFQLTHKIIPIYMS